MKELILTMRKERSSWFVQTKSQFKLLYEYGCMLLDIKTLPQRFQRHNAQLNVHDRRILTASPLPQADENETSRSQMNTPEQEGFREVFSESDEE